MPENKLPPSINRPRLLSDILEIPLSESAVPEEYTMHRPSSFPVPPPAGVPHGGQSGFQQRHFVPYQHSRLVTDSGPDSAADPGVIGQVPKRLSSSSLLSQTHRIQPLTPINPQMANRCNENRWPISNPPPVFTTSPAVSESGSPSHSRFPSIERTSSQTSLSARQISSRPRTPTPSSAGLKGRGKNQPRSSSAPSSPKSRRTPHPHGKPSVKHLTCFWWKVKGDCRFTEDDCLYAHHDTGLLADAPRQVIPGEPAKAGRHLEKALESLRAKRNPSSSSLNTSMVANPSTPESQGTSSRNTTPIEREILQERLASLQSDNNFLRNLVEQSGKEKSVLMSTIEGLQKENSNLNQDVDFLKDVVNELQQQQHRHLSGSTTSPGSISSEAKRDMQQDKTTEN